MQNNGFCGPKPTSKRSQNLKILLTGASGFTGRHFVSRHCADHEILCLDVDLLDRRSLWSAIERLDFDAVVHMAAQSYVAHDSAEDFYRVNVVGTTNLLDSLVKRKAKQLMSVLIVSSANVYGKNTSEFIDESSPLRPMNHYAASKVAMELMCQSYFNEMPLVIARPFNYTGIGQDTRFLIPKIVNAFKNKSDTLTLGNLNVEREFNDVNFICDAYMALLQFGLANETYNICTGVSYSIEDVVNVLTEITSHKVKINSSDELSRKNEIARLCGDPRKLITVFENANLNPLSYTLSETLQAMIKV